MSVSTVKKSIITVQCPNTALDLIRELAHVPVGARLIQIDTDDVVSWAGSLIETNLTARFEYTHEGES